MYVERGPQTDASAGAGIVLILDGERGSDASLLMSRLAARRRAVEIVRDEVSAMRRLIGGRVDLLILVTPTSDAAASDLREAVNGLDHPPIVAAWDARHQTLRSADESAEHASPNVEPSVTEDPIDAWSDWDASPEVLSAAELDALLGGMEPSER